MAHFAELNNEDRVIRVLTVANCECKDSQGEEREHLGVAFCEQHFGGRWVQTSYNSNIRKRYAGIGFVYNQELDAFIPPKPYASWSLDEATRDWIPPIPKPTSGTHVWDEVSGTWVAIISRLSSDATPPE